MHLLTLLLIVNNRIMYNEFLNNMNTQQQVDYEIISIDNCNKQYRSARKAYDAAAMTVSSKYIMFLHPDIRFNNPYALYEIVKYLDGLDDFGAAGIAGSPELLTDGKRVLLGNIVHGNNKIMAGRKINIPQEVQTVDECLFVVKREEYINNRFSDKDGWHLYAAELCLQAIKNGKKNYVIPADIWHISAGKSLDYKYVIQVKQLIEEYKNDFDCINTTVKMWKTKGIASRIYVEYYTLKQWFKALLLKKRKDIE